MIILVCGGRNYSDEKMVFDCLDYLNGQINIELLVHGGARGADRLSGMWAEARGVHTALVRALWITHGNGAGPIRNRIMLLVKPELVVAFPGWRGTEDMIEAATQAGINIWKPLWELQCH